MSCAGADPTHSGIVLKAPPKAADAPNPNDPFPYPVVTFENVLLSSPSESIKNEFTVRCMKVKVISLKYLSFLLLRCCLSNDSHCHLPMGRFSGTLYPSQFKSK